MGEMPYAIGIVVYNSTPALLSRLAQALERGYSLYIFDNSPERAEVRSFCKHNSRCNYFTCGKNIGLGFGISTLCAHAYYDSFPSLLFFDQDTVFNSKTLNYIGEFLRHNSSSTNLYSAFVFNNKSGNRCGSNDYGFSNVLMAINSGSLFLLDNVKKMNWHNHTYFVDGVDYEFCLNSHNMGFKIGECTVAPGFDHQSEQDDMEYLMLGKRRMMRPYKVSRIADAIGAGGRIMFTSIRTQNPKFFNAIFILLAKYLLSQFLVRFHTPITTRK